MRRPLLTLLPVLCCLVLLAQVSSHVQAERDEAGDGGLKRVTFFWGIVSYTHWPGAQGPLRVCLPENDEWAARIRESAEAVELDRPIVVHTTPPNVAGECDVVYFPAISSDEAGLVLRPLIGTPVLTIGEGDAFCSMGGIFCLLSGGDNDVIEKFAVNLDAVSRSGLRVDPQVLRLSKRKQEH